MRSFGWRARYGFASWATLKRHVESLEQVGRLKHAIDSNDLATVKALMTREPSLHGAAMGYGNNGPLTWVAECRVPWEGPGATRLAMAQWMIDHGSDVHQGGDGPLMRAALMDHRIPMMELLVANGADVNAAWGGDFPIIFAPCETLNPGALKWLLDHGADPLCGGRPERETALDYVIGTYTRSAQLAECIDILLEAGCTTRRGTPAVLEILRQRTDRLRELLDTDPGLVSRRFPELDFGNSGSRRLTLRGGTLLHVAAEYGSVEAAQLLMARGANVNARAEIRRRRVWAGRHPSFMRCRSSWTGGLTVVRLLVEAGADLSMRARLPGHYERPEEFVECTALGYARRFPGNENATVEYLLGCGAAE